MSGHDDVALRSCSRVALVRASGLESKRARCCSLGHGVLDRLSAKFKRDPFLYTTVKL